MKNLIKSIKLTLVFCVFLSVCYVLVLWAYAQLAAPGEGGNAETVTLNGKVVGVANVGQRFTQDIYFWGRPSCAGDGYDGMCWSCGRMPSSPHRVRVAMSKLSR